MGLNVERQRKSCDTVHVHSRGVVKVGLQEMQHQHPQLTSRISRSLKIFDLVLKLSKKF